MSKTLEDYPEIFSQFHPTMNGDVDPRLIKHQSGKKYFWQCPQNTSHVYDCVVNKRVNGRGCPICSGKRVHITNCLKTVLPDLAEELHLTLNNISGFDVTCYSSKILWWFCKKNTLHVWQSKVSERAKGKGCPYCAGKRVDSTNSLSSLHQDIAAELHPTKNSLSADEITARSSKKMWWQCSKNSEHIWQATCVSRTVQGSGCPICINKRAIKSNSILTTHPNLAQELHYYKNINIDFDSIIATTCKKLWWYCKSCDRDYCASGANRVHNKSACPYCKKSHGEKFVCEYLDSRKIKYLSEYTFQDCKRKRVLPFDFALFSNNRILGMIEFHGRHHYEPVKRFGGEEAFYQRIQKDLLKRAYCFSRGIPLLEICYEDFNNIPDIIEDFLKNIQE